VTSACDQSAVDIADAVRRGRQTAVAGVREAYARICSLDPTLGCFTTTYRDQALATAEAVDLAVHQGRDPGPLAGVPFAVKNLYDVQGEITLAGSLI
jgi:Asp-tRNA(Asn)/Glu-tRNA(Gln) amidotransferase A subunit family amidase